MNNNNDRPLGAAPLWVLWAVLFVLCSYLSACSSTPADSRGNNLGIAFLGGGQTLYPDFHPDERPHTYVAMVELEAGEYQISIQPEGVPEGMDTEPMKVFSRNDLRPHLTARRPILIKTRGRYEVTYVTGESAYLRLIPKKAPEPVLAATSQDHSECVAEVGQPVTVEVGALFKEGETLRDYYSGATAQVQGGSITMTPSADSQGLLLLEPAQRAEATFTWDNATVYFVITDRFYNGDPANDESYGRKRDGKEEIGTFHGGDLKGLTEKLDYLAELGVTAVWITAPYEQVHGWVGGGDRGDFKHYAYHGYYALDFTVMDQNMGEESDLSRFIDEAHARGIRVLMDVVMNHPGYSTLQDMQEFRFGGLRPGMQQYLPSHWGEWAPQGRENLHGYHALIDYDHENWRRWWGKSWVRAGIFDYDVPPNAGIDPVKGSLAFLPDFKTESTEYVRLPPFLDEKKGTRAVNLPNATPTDYLVSWLVRWVRDFGVDGFRVDTVKHVEPTKWAYLKAEASVALESWRTAHPEKFNSGDPFWMVGEVFPHGVRKDEYYQQGFDALINFDFQKNGAGEGVKCLKNIDKVYRSYAEAMNADPGFNALSYVSSHDTALFYGRYSKSLDEQKRLGTALLLLPGAVQIFYGDESARSFGPTGSDPTQGTRSAMNWEDIATGKVTPVLSHWQKLAQFRKRHPAIGAGQHQKLSEAPYAFSRVQGEDRVLIVNAYSLP